MSLQSVFSETRDSNPLNLVEEIVATNQWPYDRSGEDELSLTVAGTWCEYHLCFTWRDDYQALHLSCAFEARVPSHRQQAAYELLSLINQQMWFGHFELWDGQGLPLYRNTIMVRDGREASAAECQDLIEVAINECERFYPSFQFVSWAGKTPAEAIAAAMFDTEGEA
jgi:hypothetical protein